jgi:hypothetical protein
MCMRTFCGHHLALRIRRPSSSKIRLEPDFGNESYFGRGDMEAIGDDVLQPIGFAFAPIAASNVLQC